MAGTLMLAWSVSVQLAAAPPPLPGGLRFAANGGDPVPEGAPKVTTHVAPAAAVSRHAALR